MTAVHLLSDLDAIGARLEVAGDRLVLRAGAVPIPGDLVARVRDAKAEIVSALATGVGPVNDSRYWRERLTALTFEWSGGKCPWEEARRLAWGNLQNEWWEQHGRRWPHWQCAGCEQLIGGADAIDLPDGNRVHLDPIECLLRFGNRWRGEADRALAALAIPSGPRVRPPMTPYEACRSEIEPPP